MKPKTNNEASEAGLPAGALFGIGDRVAFQFGIRVQFGKIVAMNGDDYLIRHGYGLDIYDRADLVRRHAIKLPARKPWWKWLLCLPNDKILAQPGEKH